jgi:membrane protein
MAAAFKVLFEILAETFKGWKGDRCHGLGAGLAFFALLGLSSSFVLILLLSGRIWGVEELRGQVLPFLEHWLDPRWSRLLNYLVAEVKNFKLSGGSITIPSLIAAAFGVGNVANQMRDSIQLIWGYRVAEVSPREFLRENLWAVAVPLMMAGWSVLGIHLRIFARSELGLGFSERLSWPLAIGEFLLTGAYWGVLIAVLYKCLAPVKLAWRAVFPGAWITSFTMTAGRTIIDRYLISQEVTSAKDLVGDVFAFLLLAYFFSQFFLIGAELTHVLTKRRERAQDAHSPLHELIA